MNKFTLPDDVAELRFKYSADAIEWLQGTTKLADGSTVDNYRFYYDLLSRMTFVHKTSDSFRRNLELEPFEAQFSELQLAANWGVSRKKVCTLLRRMQSVGLVSVVSARSGSLIRFRSVYGHIPLFTI